MGTLGKHRAPHKVHPPKDGALNRRRFFFMKLKRPFPPAHLLSPLGGCFEPAPDVGDWLKATFIDPDAILRNDEHRHLRFARIGVLWTNEPNGRRGKSIIGTAEMLPPPAMGKWAKARMMQQIAGWFREAPDFIITLYAPYCAQADDASFCALCEHEMLHCGQEKGADGLPKFRQDGRPKFSMRPHDIEEFVSVVKRYGAKAAHAEEFVAAANQKPEIGRAQLDWACGTCLKVAA